MTLIVTKPFVGHGYNMPQPGEKIDPPEPQRSAILQAGVAAEFEHKVLPAPEVVKKKDSRGHR